ncbi:DMT family transporter [Mariluticola halotolerans]|uniref:DMT family transporter n=1 Tax=Mariluticola halotolerans TaxID=2909283 RepID=UPI0026E151E4|nr:DMT family transporter [Mariluticola halotolerans]UJQ95398.1 DMT family transporter [Mariluticola halotolerans]
MPIGILYALAAYASYAFGDAIIKGFGTSLSAFEIIFWVTAFSFIPVALTKPKTERLREVFATTRPRILHIRGALSLIASLCVIYAFTHIPLAETYAIVFLTPTFITVLAVLFLKEEMTTRRWLSLILGFGGVMLVVRPGFRELEPGHLAAFGCAFFASVAAVILRMISRTEKRITIVGFSVAYALVFAGCVIVISPDMGLPTLRQLGALAATGTLAGLGHILIISAAKAAPANMVAQTQYSQIVWAIILGAFFYQEVPDALGLVGLGIVVLAGFVNFTPERARTWFGAHVVAIRKRRNAAAGEKQG